ncbi:MAG TPA: DUF389 domain-containing protein [Xanthomonadaceae bacterium]|nr:DUF389 domain-containing protein [Xanthomonadaceae bacterium]
MNDDSTIPPSSGALPLGLLFDPAAEQAVRDRILPLLADRPVRPWPYRFGQLPDWAEGTTVLVYLDDAALAELAPEAVVRCWRLGLLPHPGLNQARLCFGVAQRLEHALDDALRCEKDRRVDLLSCNGRLVFNSVIVGKVFTLGGAGQAPSFRDRFQGFLRILRAGFGAMKPRPYTLTTGKDKSLATAALGIVIVEEGGSSLLSRRILDDAGSNDGMLHALVLAPRSRMEMLRFLLAALLPASQRKKPPPFVGHLKTAALTVTSPEPLDYLHDGAWTSARQLELAVAPKALRLLPGRHLNLREDAPQTKELHKVQGLPVGEARAALISKPLPWLHRASTEEFKDLYLALRDNARPAPAYLTLMVLATLLATIGLFADSAPVIIGAMILAPLMAPIISLAMAVVRQDNVLLADSLGTLGIGVLLALGCAAALTWVIPLQVVTGEIAARLNPTLLDLGVAIVSGVAGAYAHAREEVARSLAGVAIAVALVPPLAVSGIGLGWGDWTLFRGSFLLFLTNLFGIVLAGNLTFLLLGFGPFGRARRGLLVSLALVAVVSAPLGVGFARMVEEKAVVRALEGWEAEGVVLREVAVRPGDPLYLSARLLSSSTLDDAAVERVKRAIESRLDQPVTLEADVAIRR